MKKLLLLALFALPAAADVTGAVTPLGGSASSGSSSAATSVVVPTQTLNAGGAPWDSTNSLFYTSGAGGGGITLTGQANTPTSGDNQISPFDIYIKSDSADVDTLPASKWMNWLSVNGNIVSGSKGARTAIQGRYNITGTPGISPGIGYVGVLGIGRVGANLTGTSGAYGNYAGGVFGGNSNIFTVSGATFLQNVTSHEFDVAIALGSSGAEKHDATFVQTSTDSVRGVYDDSAFEFMAQDRWNTTCTTSPLSNGATGCTIATGSGMVAGDYFVIFHNSTQERRYMTCTGADPTLACTWSPALSSATTLSGGFDIGNEAPWQYGINFGSYAHLMPFNQSLTAPSSNVYVGSTLIGYSNRTAGTAKTASANIGIDFSNVTFSGSSVKLPGYVIDPNGGTAIGGVNASYPSWTTNGPGFSTTATTYTDTTGSGTIATEAANSFGPPTIAATTAATTITNLANLYLATPVAGTNVTATNLWSLQTQGAAKFGGILNASLGATIFGGNVAINKNASTVVTELCDGTTTGNCTIGGANKVLIGGALTSSGTTFTLGAGTGACATSSTLTGGAQAGSFLCTGTAGASTIVINLPTTANGWACSASDITSGVAWAQLTPTANNSCKLSGAIATTSDKVVFHAMGY